MIEIVVATRNWGKLKEIQEMLAGLPFKFLTLRDFPSAPEVAEDGETFLDNAVKKAVAIARATGKFALADDSGLEVAALAGAPGVYSARYSGPNATDETNNQKLLLELERVPGASRAARFVCVIVLAAPEGKIITAFGECAGEIAAAPRGSLGFGYDPLFYYPPLRATFSELTQSKKLAVSHRGQALRDLRQKLRAARFEEDTFT